VSVAWDECKSPGESSRGGVGNGVGSRGGTDDGEEDVDGGRLLSVPRRRGSYLEKKDPR